jgi:hypothetical protein
MCKELHDRESLTPIESVISQDVSNQHPCSGNPSFLQAVMFWLNPVKIANAPSVSHAALSRSEVEQQHKKAFPPLLPSTTILIFSINLHASQFSLLQNLCYRHTCLQSPNTPGFTAHCNIILRPPLAQVV